MGAEAYAETLVSDFQVHLEKALLSGPEASFVLSRRLDHGFRHTSEALAGLGEQLARPETFLQLETFADMLRARHATGFTAPYTRAGWTDGTSDIQQLIRSLVEEPERVAVISAPAGYGKTRLALELGLWARTALGTQVRVVDPDRPEYAGHLHELPGGRTLILVDDAEGARLGALLDELAKTPGHRQAVKVAGFVRDTFGATVEQHLSAHRPTGLRLSGALTSLRFEESAELLTRLGIQGEDFHAQIHKFAGGVPLFLILAAEHWRRGDNFYRLASQADSLDRYLEEALGVMAAQGASPHARRSLQTDLDRFLGAAHLLSPQILFSPKLNAGDRMHISGTDLQHWATQISASSTFPALIRKLILATSSGSASMRAGEGVRLSGFDGLVECQEPHNYIPQGQSVWEMGVNADIKGKADDDYDARTAKPLTVNPADTTFVFVTPRRWTGKESWGQQKRAQGHWKDVRVLDADDLEGWLSLAPGVAAWLAPILGKPSAGVFSADAYWTNWASVTRPSLTPEVVLAGWNDDPGKALQEFLAASPNALSISAESREVAAVYLAAFLTSDDDSLERDRARAVFVEDDASWAALVHQGKPSLLVPLFDRQDRVTAAVGQGHHVVVPLGRRAKSSTIKLQRQFRRILREALDTLEVSDDQKGALATLGRRSLLSLRRKLAFVEAVHRPAWATPAQAQALIAPALAGSWSADRLGDQEALSKLAGRPYDEVQRDVIRLSTEEDPPLRRTGSTWMITSKEDAWGLVAPLLSDADIQRFEEVIVGVLGAVDPGLKLPEDQRPLASFLGKELSHSGFLREDLADTLILMAVHSDEVSWGLTQSPQAIADRTVRRLLSATDLDAWRTMAWVLPKLAEASPEAFLEAVERALDTTIPALPDLFQKWEALGFGPHPAYPGLLRALERLAWSPLYIQRATLLMGRLWKATADRSLPDGPLNKLLEIFTLWVKNTSAPLRQKISVIDGLRDQMPEVAWPLMQGLIPDQHNRSTPTSQPNWRDWGQWEPRGVPNTEVHEGVSLLIDRLLMDAQGNAGQPFALLPHHRWMTAEQFDGLCTLLWRSLPSAGLEQQVKLSEKFRDFIGRQREFSETAWVMKGERLDALEVILKNYQPTDLVQRHRWLFKPAPWISVGRRGVGHDDYFKSVQERRVVALTEIVKAEGLEGVVRLLKGFTEHHEAYWVGRALAQLPDFAKITPRQMRLLIQGDASGRACLSGFIHAWLSREDRLKVQAQLSSPEVTSWSVEEQGFLLLNLPADSQTWDLITGQGQDVEDFYWERVNHYALASSPEQARRAFEQFLKVKRPDAAFDLARVQALEIGAEEWKNLLYTMLSLDAEALHNRTYEIKEVLDELSDRTELESIDVARLAWVLLPLFRFEYPPKILTNEVLNNPKLFTEVVTLAFPKMQDGEVLSEQQQREQERAFGLLHSLRGVPGESEDGTIDGSFLLKWVEKVREFLEELNQLGIGDDQIGTLLATARPNSNGDWPPPEVCDVVEQTASKALDAGLRTGRFNLRGVTSRALDDGGTQERELARIYESRATALEVGWPRTAAIMRQLAQGYWADAKREDEQADLTQDRWR